MHKAETKMNYQAMLEELIELATAEIVKRLDPDFDSDGWHCSKDARGVVCDSWYELGIKFYDETEIINEQDREILIGNAVEALKSNGYV